MPDHDLERSLRDALRTEADGLPLTITTADLERRLAVRRRQRAYRAMPAVAAVAAVLLVGVALTARWFAAPAGTSPEPSGAPPTSHALDCSPIDPTAASGPPTVAMSVVPGDAIAYGGERGTFTWRGRTVFVDFAPGSLSHLEPVPAGPPAARLRLHSTGDGCVLILSVTASAGDQVYDLRDSQTAGPSRIAEILGPPSAGEWTVTVDISFPTLDGSEARSKTSFRVVVDDPASPSPVSPHGPCDPLDVTTVERPPDVVFEVAPPTGTSIQRMGLLGAFRLAGRDVGRVGSWDHDTIAMEPATTGVLSGVTVLATNPDTCIVGVTADAVPYGSTPATTAATFVDSSPAHGRRMAAFRAPPIGDWFVRVHVEFQSTDGSKAFSESFVRIVVAKPTIEPPQPNECEPVDPSQMPTPPTVITGTSPGDAIGYGGVVTGYAWNGARDGAPGSWEFPGEPEWIGIDPAIQTLGFVSDACMLEVTAEALLIQYASSPGESPRLVELPILQGGGSRFAHAESPPTGGWLVRLRATFATTDGSEAWSETLFPVMGAFQAPSLTLREGTGLAVTAPAGCPSYELATGASAADQCGAPFEVNEAAMELAVASGRQVEVALADGWLIDQARVVAVDAGLVPAGALAPEHSVHFAEEAGAAVSFPVSLDRGRWILRVSLNGHRGDDRFGAHYDFAVNVR